MNRRHRLRGGPAFAAVRARRASGSTGLLRLALAPNGGRPARVGFVVPRREGDAVIRNRVRRRLRALLRPRLAELAGYDVVVGAGAEVSVTPWSGLTRDLGVCLVGARRRLEAGSIRPR
ncbi:MAG TPA: ribonuclease P protein component [Candidatus Dormibacteraeota bacterium]